MVSVREILDNDWEVASDEVKLINDDGSESNLTLKDIEKVLDFDNCSVSELMVFLKEQGYKEISDFEFYINDYVINALEKLKNELDIGIFRVWWEYNYE